MKHQNFDKNHARNTFMRTNMRMALVKRPLVCKFPTSTSGEADIESWIAGGGSEDKHSTKDTLHQAKW